MNNSVTGVEEITPKQSSLSLTTSLKLFITQMHDRSFGLIGPRLMEVVKCIIGTAFSLLHRRIIGTAFSLFTQKMIVTPFFRELKRNDFIIHVCSHFLTVLFLM